jgi:hypothetical protein
MQRGEKVDMSLTKEVADLLVDAMLGSVFGMQSTETTLDIGYFG